MKTITNKEHDLKGISCTCGAWDGWYEPSYFKDIEVELKAMVEREHDHSFTGERHWADDRIRDSMGQGTSS